MDKIHGWKAKRAGPAMTISGFVGDKPVKVTRVVAIEPRDGNTIATRDDGSELVLS